MKTHLLLFLLLCAATTGMAQTLVDNIDSVYTTHGTPNSQPTLRYAASNTHDSACRTDTSNYRNFDQNTHQLSSFTRNIYSYYSGSNNLHQTLFQQSAPNTDSPFVNVRRQTSTYDAYGYTDSLTDDTWDGIRWKPSSRLVLNSTPIGEVTLFLQQQWSDNRNVYINLYQTLYQYDENGNEIYRVYQRWDTTMNRWNTALSSTSTFDINGYQISETDSIAGYSTNILEPDTHTTYYNNNSGYTDSSYTFNYRDSSFIKAAITYYPNSNRYKYRYSYNYSADSILQSTNLQSHFF